MSSKSKIYSVVNEPLSAVCFVQTYVEFHFDEKIIRALTNPILKVSNEVFEFPNLGSRDQFCSLIGQTATNIILEEEGREEDRIELLFDAVNKLIIPLSESKRRGPEAAHFFSGKDQTIEVW